MARPTVRIRQLKPSYYRDKALWTGLKADTREFYIALWGIADDAGWFEWDPTTIAAEVYAFLPVNRREREVLRHAELLTKLEPDAPHLVIHVCGHAQVPKMPQHQRVSEGKRVITDASRHERGLCPSRSRGVPRVPAGSRGELVDESVQLDPDSTPVPQVPAIPRGVPRTPVPVRNGRVGNGKESAGAREIQPTSEFGERLAAHGLRGGR